MKVLALFIIMIGVFPCTAQKVDYSTVHRVVVRDSTFLNILDTIVASGEIGKKSATSVYIIQRIYSCGSLSFVFTVLDSYAILELLENKLIPLWGFFEYKGLTGLVFGRKLQQYFGRSHLVKRFDWLKYREWEAIDGIEPPPMIIEPIVWEYTVNEGKFILKSKEMIGRLFWSE